MCLLYAGTRPGSTVASLGRQPSRLGRGPPASPTPVVPPAALCSRSALGCCLAAPAVHVSCGRLAPWGGVTYENVRRAGMLCIDVALQMPLAADYEFTADATLAAILLVVLLNGLVGLHPGARHVKTPDAPGYLHDAGCSASMHRNCCVAQRRDVICPSRPPR
jgi:hypothetical protein